MYFFSKSFRIVATFATLGIALSHSYAKAEVFVIEDQSDKFTVSFPDSWTQIENQKPDDKLTIAGPGPNEYATCRVRVREDKRFLIYPMEYSSAIQHTAYSRKFWEQYLGEYDDVVIDAFKDDSGVGLAYASTAESSYLTVTGTPVRKRSIAFAGVYRDNSYIVECSSEQTLYSKWRPVFLSIVKSITFEKEAHEFPEGHYRSFLADPEVTIQGERSIDIYKF